MIDFVRSVSQNKNKPFMVNIISSKINSTPIQSHIFNYSIVNVVPCKKKKTICHASIILKIFFFLNSIQNVFITYIHLINCVF